MNSHVGGVQVLRVRSIIANYSQSDYYAGMNFWFFLAWLYFILALNNPAFWGLALLFFVLGLHKRDEEAKPAKKKPESKDGIDLKK